MKIGVRPRHLLKEKREELTMEGKEERKKRGGREKGRTEGSIFYINGKSAEKLPSSS